MGNLVSPFHLARQGQRVGYGCAHAMCGDLRVLLQKFSTPQQQCPHALSCGVKCVRFCNGAIDLFSIDEYISVKVGAAAAASADDAKVAPFLRASSYCFCL